MRTFKLKKCKYVAGLSYSPDSSRLIVLIGYESHGFESVVSLDTMKGEPLELLSCVSENYLFSADRTRFVIGTHVYSRSDLPNFVRWCDPRTEVDSWNRVSLGPAWPSGTTAVVPQGMAFTSDSARLLIAYGRQRFPRNGIAAEWSYHLAEGDLAQAFGWKVIELEQPMFALAHTPVGRHWVASTVIDGRPALNVYDRPAGPPLARFVPKGSRHQPTILRYSPNGRYLAVVIARAVHVLDGERLTPISVLEGHTGQVNAVAFSPNSERILTASHDGLVRTFDPETGQSREAFDWKIGAITALAFSPEGLTCAAAGQKGQLVIWDVD